MSTDNNPPEKEPRENADSRTSKLKDKKLSRTEQKNARYKDRESCVDEILGKASLFDDNDAAQKKLFEQEEARLAKHVAEVSSSAKVTGDCNALLSSINTLVNATPLERSAVLDKLDKLKQRLIRAFDSRVASLYWFGWITVSNVAWLIVFVGLIAIFRLVPGHTILHNTAWVVLACALWGGIGGVVDAFFSLHIHLAYQDFDEEYVPWYFLHPFLGMALGAVVYIVLSAGLLAIAGTPLQEASANVTGTASNAVAANVSAAYSQAVETGKAGATALPIALAFLAGFRQTTIVKFLTRIVNAIFQGNEKSPTE